MRSGMDRWRYRLLAGTAAVALLAVAAAATFGNHHSGLAAARFHGGRATGVGSIAAPTQQPVKPRAGQSAIVQVDIGAPELKVPTETAYVYLPPGYDDPANAGRRYPVIYLLHGYPGRPANWMSPGGVPDVMNTLIGTRQIGPMIVVAPNDFAGRPHDSECLNKVGGPQIADYLTGPVVRFVDAHFRTIPDRRARAIGGLSSGGYCGLNLGLRHQNVFSVMLSWEPYGDPGRTVIKPLLGGSTQAYFANSPMYYLPTLRIAYPMSAFMDVGGSFVRDIRRVESLVRQVESRKIPVDFRIEPGQQHTWKEAVAGMSFAISFAARHLLDGMHTEPAMHRYTTAGLPPGSAFSASVRAYAPLAARCQRRYGPRYIPAGSTYSDSCVRM